MVEAVGERGMSLSIYRQYNTDLLQTIYTFLLDHYGLHECNELFFKPIMELLKLEE